MAFTLPVHIHEKMQAIRQYTDDRKAEFRCLNDADLATAMEFWMQHCVRPRECDPDSPTYDSTVWHAIIPVMIDRLKGQMTPTDFRATLATLRFTQRAVARDLNVDPTTVNRWATGRLPVPPRPRAWLAAQARILAALTPGTKP